MKKLIFTLIAIFLTTTVNAADFRYNVPLPTPAPIKYLDATVPYIETAALHLAQNVNPDPFNSRGTPTQQSNPAVSGQPVVVQSTPVIDTTPGLLSWVLTAIGGTGVGGILLNLFRKPAQNQNLENTIEQVLGKLLNSNEVRGLARTGLGFVPGVGGFANQIEEVANRAAKAALNAKFGTDAIVTTTPVDQDLDAWKNKLLQEVGNIVQNRIEAALAKRTTS